MPDLPTSETDFVCDCEEGMRSACAGQPFYRQNESKRYCVLHFPSKAKSPDFKQAIQQKLDGMDFNFQGVWFPDELTFEEFEFARQANFSSVTFNAKVNFRSATFMAEADFSGATFQAADFSDTIFSADVSFNGCSVNGELQFFNTSFGGMANFRRGTFGGPAFFSGATYSKDVDFTSTTFKGEAVFISVSFASTADFSEGDFNARVSFDEANFSRASFSRTRFSGLVSLTKAIFREVTVFFDATFAGPAFFGGRRSARFEDEVYFGGASFKQRVAFDSVIFQKKASFQNVRFSDEASFLRASFKELADFWRASFFANVDFINTTFESLARFDHAVFRGDVRFEGDGRTGFKATSSLTLRNAKVDRPESVSFWTVALRPHWFVNVDARRFDFTNVDWRLRSVNEELQSLKDSGLPSAHRMLSIACRHLAVNAEENHRYEEGSKFRYFAMEARRLEDSRGWVPWRLSWWYWLASGYGERILRAFIVLVAIWFLAAVLYTRVGFANSEPRTLTAPADVAKRDDAGAPLKFSRALTYSAGVMTLQKPEPKPATTAAQSVVLLETILGPVQAALLALAIRRKFMR